MVRRLGQSETFHGTAAGQAPNVGQVSEMFDLTERQAQCVALLRMGTKPQGVAEVLGISTSTLETHLSDLRGKFDAPNTTALIKTLLDVIPDDTLDAFHCWPAQTNALLAGGPDDRAYGAALRTTNSVEEALSALRDALGRFGARHLYYCFLPHSVQGFLRGDIVDAILASEEIEAAFRANAGLMGQPAALELFNAPVSVPVVTLTQAEGQPKSLAAFYGACQDAGATHMVVLGFPAGPGFVGMAITLAAEADPRAKIAEEAEAIRTAAMAMHAVVLTNGTLAARYRLTIRERDALSAISLGKRGGDAAAEMKISERAFAKLLSSARGKLNARTNAEAVGKAALVNALVFL